MAQTDLIACHECDLLHTIKPTPSRNAARCTRCGAALYRDIEDSIGRTLMLTLAAVILFVLANVFPFMTFKMEGREQHNTLFAGCRGLYEQGFWELGLLVFACSILAPALRLLGVLYVLVPLYFGRRIWRIGTVARWVITLLPWAMMEVYMLGVLVAIVKLSDFATIVIGTALYSFVALIIVTTWSNATIDPREIWNRLPLDEYRRET